MGKILVVSPNSSAPTAVMPINPGIWFCFRISSTTFLLGAACSRALFQNLSMRPALEVTKAE